MTQYLTDIFTPILNNINDSFSDKPKLLAEILPIVDNENNSEDCLMIKIDYDSDKEYECDCQHDGLINHQIQTTYEIQNVSTCVTKFVSTRKTNCVSMHCTKYASTYKSMSIFTPKRESADASTCLSKRMPICNSRNPSIFNETSLYLFQKSNVSNNSTFTSHYKSIDDFLNRCPV